LEAAGEQTALYNLWVKIRSMTVVEVDMADDSGCGSAG